jgi:hypothetical protein
MYLVALLPNYGLCSHHEVSQSLVAKKTEHLIDWLID